MRLGNVGLEMEENFSLVYQYTVKTMPAQNFDGDDCRFFINSSQLLQIPAFMCHHKLHKIVKKGHVFVQLNCHLSPECCALVAGHA